MGDSGSLTPQQHSAQRQIDGLRQKLLDISNRNPLVSFRHADRARGQVRVIDELPDILHQKLGSGAKLSFVALPHPPDQPKDETTDAFLTALDAARATDVAYRRGVEQLDDEDLESPAQGKLERDLKDRVREQLGLGPVPDPRTVSVADWARANGLDPKYELPLPASGEQHGKHADNRIQTLLMPEAMERKLSGQRQLDRSMQQEMGVNALYCAFGFLEWYESETSEQARVAPLLLLPLDLSRDRVRGRYVYAISGSGEEMAINLPFSERLDRDFGIRLPEVGAEDTPEMYLARVREVIAHLPRWRVRRWVTVGLFAFQRLVMYRDLDPEHWPAGLERHPILAPMLGGTDQRGSGSFADEHNVDDPEIAGEIPFLIADADSSQFSAIVDVMKGNNLALEGPPGTGKSQTITNVIAAAMGKGKRVLFLAEKMAALEVVKARLDHANLGEFCLELHSSRARKKDVLEGLASRLRLRAGRQESGRLMSARHELETLRGQLGAYVDLLNQPFGGLGRKIQELLWAELATRDSISRLPDGIEAILLDTAAAMDAFGIDRARATLATLEQRDREMRAAFGAPETHPWHGVGGGNLSSYDREELCTAIAHCRDALAEALAVLRAEVAPLGYAVEELRLDQALEIGEQISRLPGQDPSIDDEQFARLADRDTLTALEEMDQALSRHADILRMDKIAEDEERLLDSEAAGQVQGLAKRLGIGEIAFDQLAEHAKIHQVQADLWRDIDTFCQDLGRAFGAPGPAAPQDLAAYLDAVAMVVASERRMLEMRSAELDDAVALEGLEQAISRAQDLRARRQSLAPVFALQAAPAPLEIRAHVAILRSTGRLGAWLSREVKAARRAHGSMSGGRKADDDTIAADLERIAAYLEDTAKLEGDARLVTICGWRFAGLDSDFAGLLAVTRFAAEVRRRFPGTEGANLAIRNTLLDADIDAVEGIRLLAQRPTFGRLGKLLTGQADRTIAPPAGQERAHRDRVHAMKMIARLGKALRLRPNARPCDLAAAVQRARALAAARAAVESNRLAKELLGSAFGGIATDRDLIAKLIDHARAIEHTGVPAACRRHIHVGGQSRVLAELAQLSERLRSALDHVRRTIGNALVEQDHLDPVAFLGVRPREAPLVRIAARLDQALAARDALAEWSGRTKAIAETRDSGFGQILDAYDAASAPYEGLEAALERVVHRNVVRAAFRTHALLQQFDGLTQDQARHRFAALDREIIDLEREALRSELAARTVEPGSSIGPAAEHTGRCLVEREMAKRQRHIPLRHLLRRAGQAIQDMKPCFMMSPLSVAQYLEPGAVDFDLLVIDEASQMRPEDAVGAIARARQVVVVGDTKQLPPTSFFDRIDEPDDEEESLAPESILGLALNTFRPARRLRWHYRSRDASLIAFSNRRFYADDLIVFPTPRARGEGFGIEYRPVEGCYKAGINIDEVQAISHAAIDFMCSQPDLSLGVVAVNKAQAELITAEIDRLAERDRSASDYIRGWDERLERFFVKNLETVQGDERDVIMISTVYGPDETGKVNQRFGPINSDLGWRRLNVLFTRAKNQIVLFSSLRANDIIVGDQTLRGVSEFRAYLEYAATGRLEGGDQSRPVAAPDSDFEAWVGERLEAQGYEVVPQVGVAGYFIDLAVRHPANRDGFLLGIECDGATYHSAKSARDRDRLRQEVLEGLGWQLYRIWSTDWFDDPNRELQKLIRHIEHLALATTEDDRDEASIRLAG